MRFYSEAIRGDLILIRTNIPTPPACPVLAQSAPAVDPLLVRFILWLLATFARPTLATARATRNAWQPITPEALPVLRIGIVFMLVAVGTIATLAARG
jgi:hypothetical protein